jgi:hypothetical protein
VRSSREVVKAVIRASLRPLDVSHVIDIDTAGKDTAGNYAPFDELRVETSHSEPRTTLDQE